MSTFAKSNWMKAIARTLPGLGLAGWLAGFGVSATAQEAAGAPTKSYLNKTTITLPVLLEDRYRSQLQSIQLFVKEGPISPWKLHEKAPPSQTSFTYRATGEGELWFNIVSVDTMGRSVPADVTKEAPALVVVIDTQAPQVNVQALHNAAEGQYVRCEARDKHLDNLKTRFYYQTGDQMWRDVAPQPGRPDTFCVPSQAVWTGMVRIVASDLAGNGTTREINVGATAAAGPALPANPALTNAVPRAIADNLIPAPGETLIVIDPVTLQPQGSAPTTRPASASPQTTQVPLPPPPISPPVSPSTTVVHKTAPVSTAPLSSAPVAVAPPASETPRNLRPIGGQQLYDPATAKAPAPLPTAVQHEVKTTALLTKEPSPANRHLSTSGRMHLDYKVESMGVSGVGKVEVWYSRDLGQSWHKLCEDTDRQSPVEINLPGEGLFGVSLVVSNGRGFGANPPRTGDSPDYWIEIDTTRPLADITAIHAAEDGALHISWGARDKNLTPEPIELAYAANRDGPWHVIAKGLKNDGGYRWMPPAEVGPQAFFRVTVRDLAGNITHAETTQPVPLDDQSRPRGRVLGINPAAAPRPVSLPPTP
jgi:hypothetical protein